MNGCATAATFYAMTSGDISSYPSLSVLQSSAVLLLPWEKKKHRNGRERQRDSYDWLRLAATHSLCRRTVKNLSIFLGFACSTVVVKKDNY